MTKSHPLEVTRVVCESVPDLPNTSWSNALVFPKLWVEIDAIARLDVDLREASLAKE